LTIGVVEIEVAVLEVGMTVGDTYTALRVGVGEIEVVGVGLLVGISVVVNGAFVITS
jgi:hypothetical protein